MRWLFLFVLALNLVYIAWQVNQQPDAPVASRQPLKNVPPIVLLSELGERSGQEAVLAQNSAPQEASRKEPAAADKPAESGPTKDEAAPVVAAAPEESLAEPIEETTAPETAAPVEEKSAAKAPPTKTAEKPAVASAQEIHANKAGACYTMGPFRDLDKLRALTRDIRPYVANTRFRGEEVKEQSLYWAYIKPLGSRKKALATGKQLKNKKIKDFYIIREGDKLNGISLGYFRNKAGATGLVKKVRKLGFDAVLEPVFKTYTVYWLDYALLEGKSLPESMLDKVRADNKNSNISRMAKSCAGL